MLCVRLCYMITSTANAKVKNVIALCTKAKVRREQNAYIVEGIRMFKEAPRHLIKEIYMTEQMMQKENLQDCFSWGVTCELVSEEVFSKMSDTKTPQGILCVMEKPDYDIEEILSVEAGLWVVLEDIQDPGNLGTILRTGEGAGINGVIMSKGCVDIFNPKTIRSTMGSVYRVPFIYIEDFASLFTKLDAYKITSYAAHLLGKKQYDEFDYRTKTAFVIGNEGNGLTQETANQTSEYLRIPMEGKVESLNAAMACGILMYEAHRQRR